jgi:hypothetical protein
MTHKVIEIDGIKYNLVPVEQKSNTLRSRLEEMFDHNEVQVIFDEIKKFIPDEAKTEDGGDEYEWYEAWNCGYNCFREQILTIMQ